MPVAEEIVAAIQRFTHAAEGLEREVSGLVRITCPPDVAQVIVTPVHRELRVVHPALRFQLDPGAAVLGLARARERARATPTLDRCAVDRGRRPARALRRRALARETCR